MHGARRIAPSGQLEQGTMARPTIENGAEPLVMADITGPMFDIRGSQGFKPFYETNIHHFVGGRIYVRVDEIRPAGSFDLHADVRIFSFVAGMRDLVKVGAVNTATGPLLFDLEGYKTSFVAIVIEARQVLNGVPSAAPVPKLMMSIAGRLFR